MVAPPRPDIRTETAVAGVVTLAAVGNDRSGELSQAVHGEHDLQPRRRRRAHRLSVAGVGGHPQPDPDRPRRRGAAAAVAGVHPAGRRDHRSRRPPHVDGVVERARAPCSPSASRSPCSAGRDALPAPDDVGRRVDRDTDTILYVVIVLATLLLGIAEVLYDNSAQTFMPSIVHADESGTGQRADVERRAGRQHVRRPAARSPADRGRRSACRSSPTPPRSPCRRR